MCFLLPVPVAVALPLCACAVLMTTVSLAVIITPAAAAVTASAAASDGVRSMRNDWTDAVDAFPSIPAYDTAIDNEPFYPFTRPCARDQPISHGACDQQTPLFAKLSAHKIYCGQLAFDSARCGAPPGARHVMTLCGLCPRDSARGRHIPVLIIYMCSLSHHTPAHAAMRRIAPRAPWLTVANSCGKPFYIDTCQLR